MPAFELEMSSPIKANATQGWGGPGVGGHTGPNWYEAYGMDLGAIGGTPLYAAFDGHITRLNLGNVDQTSGKHFGAELFVRSHNDLMGAFYTHFRDLPPELAQGASIGRGQLLGTLVPVVASPHVHLALVEIINGAYVGVDLYSWFLQHNGQDATCTVTFHQDGTAPTVRDGGGAAPSGIPRIDLGIIAGIQLALAALGYDPGSPDGVDGPRTRAAVMAFQRDHGLDEDGIAGPNTKETLAVALAAAGVDHAPA